MLAQRTNSIFRTLFCLAFVASAVAASAQKQPGQAVVKALAGTATYVDELGFSHPVEVGTVLKEGQTIRTGPDSSVSLFLAQNGPGVGLEAGTTLRFEKLSYEPSALGAIIDTRLELQAGQLFGSVDKLLPGARYEVSTPQGVVKVRGTEFFIDTNTGAVHVTSGTVTVRVQLNTQQGQLVKDISVAAGQSLFVPNKFDSVADFNNLAAVATPPNLDYDRLVKLWLKHKLVRSTGSGLTETYQARIKNNNKIKVKKPPISLVVSP